MFWDGIYYLIGCTPLTAPWTDPELINALHVQLAMARQCFAGYKLETKIYIENYLLHHQSFLFINSSSFVLKALLLVDCHFKPLEFQLWAQYCGQSHKKAAGVHWH